MQLKVFMAPLKSIEAIEPEMNAFLSRSAGFQPAARPKVEGRSFQFPSPVVVSGCCGLQIRGPDFGFVTHSRPELRVAVSLNPKSVVGQGCGGLQASIRLALNFYETTL